MDSVYVCGVGMTPFGKYPDRSLKDLGREAVDAALADAGVAPGELNAAYVANAMAGIVTGQECIRGQVVLSAMGIHGLPVVNVENACASGATALHLAWTSVAAGLHDVVLVLGVEKLFHADRSVTYKALAAATDIEAGQSEAGKSSFLEESNRRLGRYMQEAGATLTHVAKVAHKSHRNSALNPYAQYREVYTLDQILRAPQAAPPLTRLMCSPISDGAAALVVCSAAYARRRGMDRVRVAASVLRSAAPAAADRPGVAQRTAQAAYEMAGLGPEALSVAEVHDTTAASELMLYEGLGFCARHAGPQFVDDGGAELGGRLPVNPSGGLVSRGHPVAATGVAQICELAWQLRGRAEARQVADARVALAHNAGGTVLGESASACIHILVADR